jgi:hypothetical protein
MWPLELIWSIGSMLAVGAWIGWVTHEENVRKKHWVRTSGKVVAATAEAVGCEFAFCCSVSVTYEYVRCGERYEGKDWLGESHGFSYAQCEALALRLVSGTPISVRVDPANSTRSKLDRSASSPTFAAMRMCPIARVHSTTRSRKPS